MSTAFVYAPAQGHTLAHHPENARRLAGILPRLEEEGLLAELTRLEPQPAGDDQIERVHTPAYRNYVQALSARGGGHLNPDTYLTSASYDLALLAAGGCLAVVDAVADGRAANGLALVRPPGHHAFAGRGEGFCLFNNIAIAARHAQVVHGWERLLIFDFDVHHGNGTQDIFYADEAVLFISLHMQGAFFYPGSGRKAETGIGAGRGTTINIPFPPGVGDTGYGKAMAGLVEPAVRRFRPELILVSAGFDAHWQDPLAAAELSLTGYQEMVRRLLALAEELCGGHIVFVLEGGYFLPALEMGIVNLVNALTGRAAFHDPLGPSPRPETEVTNLLSWLKQRHLLN